MANKGNAQILEVVGRQFAQDLAIYRVIVKCGRVLFEPQPAQPRRYVRAVILGSEEWQALMEGDNPLSPGLPAGSK
jgi:hypothetical protein